MLGRLFLGTVLLGILLLACGPEATPSGIARADAIAAARRAAPDAIGVIGATTGPISEFEIGQQIVPGTTLVWAVVLSGRFALSCGPAPRPGESPHSCPAPATSETVLIDYQTGEFLLAFSHGG